MQYVYKRGCFFWEELSQDTDKRDSPPIALTQRLNDTPPSPKTIHKVGK